MTLHQQIRTKRLTEDDVRTLEVECPFCGDKDTLEVGTENAQGAVECLGCGEWFEYKEWYEEIK